MSFGASSYYVPGSSPSDIPNFNAALNNTRELSAHTDPYAISGYQNNLDFVLGYLGFETAGLFRSYPGSGTLDTDPTRSYDPRLRGWYMEAFAKASDVAQPDKMVYTSPYLDFNGRGWMITLAQAVRNFETNQLVGVAGGDMLISTIQETLRAIRFLDSGKVTLFEDSGVVVADPEWNADPNVQTGFTYKNLQNPPVSDSLWAEIVAVTAGTTINLNKSDYVISSTRLEGFGNKYILATFIPRSEVIAPMQSIIDDQRRLNLITCLVLAAVFLVISVLAVILIACVASKIQKPLEETQQRIETVIGNVGRDDLGAGLSHISNVGMGDEQHEFVDGVNTMVETVQRYKEETANTYVDNDFAFNPNGPTHAFIQGGVPDNAYFASAPSMEALGMVAPKGVVPKEKVVL